MTIRQTVTTLRSESPAFSYHEDDDEASGIVSHRLDPDEARTHFLPTGERDPNSSSRISRKRKSYRSSSEKRPKGGPSTNGLINGIDVSSDEEVEPLERRLARLQKEVAEVKEEFERRKAKKWDGATQEPHHEAETLDTLSQILESVDPTDADGGAASRLTKRLVAATKPLETSAISVDGPGSRPAQQDNASATYIVTYAPNHQEEHTLSKVSDFDSRLTLIEAALGLDAIPLPTQERSPFKAVLPALDTLDRKLATLSTSTDTSLDKFSRRVRQLTQDAEKLEQARIAAKAAQEALSPSSGDFPLNGPAKDLDVLDDAEQRSKIKALYATLSTIESLAPLLPSVLDRLRSLRSFHADAATASQTLAKLETRQEDATQELQSWREGLKKVESAMEQGEQTVKGNTQTVEGWVKELEERMGKLDS